MHKWSSISRPGEKILADVEVTILDAFYRGAK